MNNSAWTEEREGAIKTHPAKGSVRGYGRRAQLAGGEQSLSHSRQHFSSKHSTGKALSSKISPQSYFQASSSAWMRVRTQGAEWAPRDPPCTKQPGLQQSLVLGHRVLVKVFGLSITQMPQVAKQSRTWPLVKQKTLCFIQLCHIQFWHLFL